MQILRSSIFIVMLGPVFVAFGEGPTAQANGPGDQLMVRIALDEVPGALRERVDACAVERIAGQRYAVILMTAVEQAALQARHEVLGTLKEHIRRFAPTRTLQKKAVPSIERYVAAPQRARRPAGADPCQDIGTSFAPYDEYHTLAEGRCLIANLVTAHGDIAEMRTIGTTVEGRDIIAVRISDNIEAVEPAEQRILFTGVTHAREWVTHEMMMYMTEQLLSGYGSDDAITHVIDNSEVWLVPVVNPDGYEFSWTDNRMWRKNRRIIEPCDSGTEGVDINRNYDYGWGPHPGSSGNLCSQIYRGPEAASEPETQAIQNLLSEQRFAVGVSYHSYSQLVLFPWGHTTDTTPESYTSLRAIGRTYAQTVEARHGQRYVPGQSSYTIYLTNGDFDDYAYGAQGTLSFTPELRPESSNQGGFLLPEAQILPTCQENFDAALWLMGVVADAAVVQRADGQALFDRPVGGIKRFSLPVTPINQKPEIALGLPSEAAGAFSTRMDDQDHDPPIQGILNTDFEGLGSGSAYELSADNPAAAEWAAAVTSYVGLPTLFESGAEVLLSNVDPAVNWIGVPGAAPIRLADVQVLERRLDSDEVEIILEQRSAIEDAESSDPWIDWTWVSYADDGTLDLVHPTGAKGADYYVQPYRLYEVQVNVASSNFDDGTNQPVYLLQFPPADPDCDDDGILDDVQLAAGDAFDCNTNGVPDLCEVSAGLGEDCNDNGLLDGCEMDTHVRLFSGPVTPVDGDEPKTLAWSDLVAAASDVIIEISAHGDFSGSSEYLDVRMGGAELGRLFDAQTGVDCPNASVGSFLVPAGAFNNAIVDGALSFDLLPSDNVHAGECSDGGSMELSLQYQRRTTDCNGNGVLDACDIANGLADCNQDATLDVCQIGAFVAQDSPVYAPLGDDLDAAWVVNPASPAAGDVALRVAAHGDLSSPLENIQLYMNDTLIGTVFDYVANDCPDTPDRDTLVIPASVFNGLLGESNEMRIRPVVASGVSPTQCADGSWIRYTLEYPLAETDCNGNQQLDSCEINAGATDCNEDGVLDSCQLSNTFSSTSPEFVPLGTTLTHTYRVTDVPPAFGTVQLTILARGDLNSALETLEIKLDGTSLGSVFADSANDCPDEPDTAELIVDAATFNAALADGTALIEVIPSANVSIEECAESGVRVRIAFQVEPFDCDSNGLLDSCEVISNPERDCDRNGRLDICDLSADPALDCDGNLALDSCEITADPALDCNTNAALDVCDIATGASTDFNGNGIPDECETFPTLEFSHPPTGAIDARQPLGTKGQPVGWQNVEITFTGDISGFTATDFGVNSTVGKAQTIESIFIDDQTVTVELSQPIAAGACTVITHLASNQRVELGYLPADVNADGTSGPLDILAIIDHLNGTLDPAAEQWQCDANRSHSCEPLDILRVIDLLNGAGNYDAWNGRVLPACP